MRAFARVRPNIATLKKSEIPKERYLNRSEWMANRYKDSTTASYDWVPEVMPSIDPAPSYPIKGLEANNGKDAMIRKMPREGAFKGRNSFQARKMKQEKYKTGRLFAHLKQVEMQNYVRGVRKQEGTLKEEELSDEQRIEKVKYEMDKP